MAGRISYKMVELEGPNIRRSKGDSFSQELNSEVATENQLQRSHQALMLTTIKVGSH